VPTVLRQRRELAARERPAQAELPPMPPVL
jgi:hypothetical protein